MLTVQVILNSEMKTVQLREIFLIYLFIVADYPKLFVSLGFSDEEKFRYLINNLNQNMTNVAY